MVVDEDDGTRTLVALGLADAFDRVLEVSSAEMALYSCVRHAVDVVATSIHLSGMGADLLCTELVDHAGPPVVAYDLPDSGDRRTHWLEEVRADCMSGHEPSVVAARCRAVVRRTRLGPRPRR